MGRERGQWVGPRVPMLPQEQHLINVLLIFKKDLLLKKEKQKGLWKVGGPFIE